MQPEKTTVTETLVHHGMLSSLIYSQITRKMVKGVELNLHGNIYSQLTVMR